MHARTRIKFCGITRVEDALDASAFGADALGFVFYQASPRHVTVSQARDIVTRLPPFITKVGLFVDAPPDDIKNIAERVGLDLIQYHGDESPARCAAVERPYIKAIRMAPGIEVNREAERYAESAALLLDTFDPRLAGGTGHVFDWERVPKDCTKPIILAGGLRQTNVTLALEKMRPYAVDVSSGIEIAKGIKDPKLMQSFIREVRSSEC